MKPIKTRIYSDILLPGGIVTGLALRAIHQLMEEEPAAPNRIAIIFTDASPNDDRKIPASLEHGFALSRDYSGNAAVKDVATEVRALKKDGIQVMAHLKWKFRRYESCP